MRKPVCKYLRGGGDITGPKVAVPRLWKQFAFAEGRPVDLLHQKVKRPATAMKGAPLIEKRVEN
jgi:hypothetical protein